MPDPVKEKLTPNRKGWNEFKTNALNVLPVEFGLSVSTVTGHGGPVKPTTLKIPDFIGASLAGICLAEGFSTGNAKDKLFSKTNDELKKHIEQSYITIEWSDFRSGFNSIEKSNECYKFRTKSWDFERKKSRLAFNNGSGSATDERKLEHDLVNKHGKELTSEFHELWNIEADSGSSRVQCLANNNRTGSGKLQNVDIAVVAKQWRIDRDEVRIAAIELKASNELSSLFKALSQAASYRSQAHEVWVAAPGLKQEHFNDVAQYHNFFAQCRENGFGILNIGLTENGKQVEDIEVVLRARSTPIVRPSLQRRVLSELGWKYCVKCARLYTFAAPEEAESSAAENSVMDCGWQIGDECARQLEERLLMRAKHEDSPHTGEQQG